jgi:hypothetical protein
MKLTFENAASKIGRPVNVATEESIDLDSKQLSEIGDLSKFRELKSLNLRYIDCTNLSSSHLDLFLLTQILVHFSISFHKATIESHFFVRSTAYSPHPSSRHWF